MKDFQASLYLSVPAALAYFNLNSEAVCILLALITLDTILGASRAWIIDKRTFSSSMLRHGFIAKVLLLLIPFIVIGIGKAVDFQEGMGKLATAAIDVLAISEGYSCISNIGMIVLKNSSGAESDAISGLISKILGVLKKMIDGLTKE